MAKRKRSKNFYFLGESISRRSVYLGFVTLLLVVAGVAAGLYYFMLQNQVPVSHEERSLEATVEGAEPLPAPVMAATEPLPAPMVAATGVDSLYEDASLSPLKRVLSRHLRVTGLNEVDSYIINASLLIGGIASDRVVMARAPNLYILKTKSVGTAASFQFGYDGARVWFWASQSLSPEVESTIGLPMGIMLMRSSITQLAWSYRAEGSLSSVLELRPSVTWNGRKCEVIVSRSILPFPMTHYLDAETYEEVYRSAEVPKQDGVSFVEMHFEPSDESLSFRMPMGYDLYIDGELDHSAKYTKIRVNQMMLPSLFDAPSDSIIRSDWE